MHGMPMSNVAPRGMLGESFGGAADPPKSRIVSEEFFRFKAPLIVEALAVETTLPCFSCETVEGEGRGDFELARVTESGVGGREVLFFGGGVGGTPDLRTVAFLCVVEIETVEVVERAELVEMVLLVD